jgi:hypothetical protein
MPPLDDLPDEYNSGFYSQTNVSPFSTVPLNKSQAVDVELAIHSNPYDSLAPTDRLQINLCPSTSESGLGPPRNKSAIDAHQDTRPAEKQPFSKFRIRSLRTRSKKPLAGIVPQANDEGSYSTRITL